MGKGRSLRAITFLWVAVSLLSPLATLADPNVLDFLPGYALGYYTPEGETGFLHDTGTPFSVAAYEASYVSEASYVEEVVRLINSARQAAGLPPFKVNPILTAEAAEHSAVMRDTDCFAHQCPGEPSAAERICDAGYGPYGWGACYIGETIAAGFADPVQAVDAWMASPGHRDILLHGKLREIGVGCATGGFYGYYLTADFGSQPDVIPVFINYDDAATDSRQVTLTLTNEEVSGYGGMDYAHEVQISNDSGFAGAKWELYTLHKSWTLAEGDGQKIVYVKYRDPSGYEVTSSDDILLGAPLPCDLEVSTHSLSFVYEVGNGFQGPTAGRVEINTGCDSAMTWSATRVESWIHLEPTAGMTPGDLVISVDGFEATTLDNYQTTVTVSSPQAQDSIEEVHITIRVVGEIHRVVLPLVGMRH